jgi:hypothetical protein
LSIGYYLNIHSAKYSFGLHEKIYGLYRKKLNLNVKVSKVALTGRASPYELALQGSFIAPSVLIHSISVTVSRENTKNLE